jgi:hypothetical protein
LRTPSLRFAAAAAAFWILAATAIAGPRNLPTTTPVRFLMLGDTGTGERGQYAVAEAMAEVCAKRGCQFAIDVGDNIYEYGPKGVDDPQFQEKFEKPYAQLAFPFFMALGNHDQSGTIPGSGVHPEKGDYEVSYTRQSNKWTMPGRYYRFGVPFASATDFHAQVDKPVVEFFAIDTNDLAPQNMPQYDWYRPLQKYDTDQRKWLRDSLKASKAAWNIVFGHHPYLNNGKHGNAGQFFGLGLAKGEELKKMYEEEVCGKADFLVVGHDHSLQWLSPNAACGVRPQFIVSGAGAKPEKVSAPGKNPAVWEAFDTLGFFWAEATPDALTLVAYTVDEKGKATQAFEKTVHK